MDSLFNGGGIRTLRKMVKKGLIKVEDLDTEAAFMKSLIPPKEVRIEKESSEESSQPKQELEKDVLLMDFTKDLIVNSSSR